MAPGVTNAAPRLTRRQWILRVGGVVALLAAGAIIAGVLSSKAHPKGVARRPDTVKQSTSGGPAAVLADNKPVIDPTYPYQLDGKVDNPSSVPTTTTTKTPDKQTTVGGITVPANASLAGIVTAVGWGAIGGGPPNVCYPANFKELLAATKEESPCVVIVLTRSNNNPYNVAETMVIRSLKIIVGNPINLPHLKPKDVERLFLVENGGSLDLRGVMLTRGRGREYDLPGLGTELLETRVIMGGSALIYPGGQFHARGVVFTLTEQTVEKFIEDLETALRLQMNRSMGGHILMLAGNLRLEGCFILTIRPLGNPVINSINIGRDMTVIFGQATFIGCFTVNVQGYTSALIAGNALAVLGGNSIWVGGGVTSVNGGQGQYGVGKQLLVGAGSLIDVGFAYISVNGFLHRAGYGQYTTCAGVYVRVGYQQLRAFGVAAIWNYGQTFTTGAGIQHIIGGGVATSSNALVFAGVGGRAGMGPGNGLWIGVPQVSVSLTQAQFGLGLVYSCASGDFKVVLSPEGTSQLARIQANLGTVIYVGAGLAQMVNVTRFTAQGVNAFYGAGNLIYVGAGGIMSTISKTYSARIVEDRTKIPDFSTPLVTTPVNTAYTVGAGKGLGGNAAQGAHQEITIFYTNNAYYKLQFGKWTSVVYRNRRMRKLQGDTQALNGTQDGFITWVGEGENATATILGQPNFAAIVDSTNRLYNISIKDPNKCAARRRERRALQLAADEYGSVLGLGFPTSNIDELVSAHSAALAGCAGLDLLDPATTQAENQIRVHGSNKENCLLANLKPSGDLGSAGFIAEDPLSQDSCNALDFESGTSDPLALHKEAVAQVPGFQDPATDFSLINADGSLPETTIYQARLYVHCRYTDASKDSNSITSGCLNPQAVKYALLDYYDLPTNTPLTVSPTTLPKSIASTLKAVLGFDAEDNYAPSDFDQLCPGYSAYEVYAVSQNPGFADRINQHLKDAESNPDILVDILAQVQAEDESEFGQPAETEICGASLKVNGKLTVPGATTAPWQPSASTSKAPSVSIGDGVNPSFPTRLTIGDEYSIFLSNFPQGNTILVKLIKGTDVEGPIVARVKNFNDDNGKSYSEVKWTLSLADVGGTKPQPNDRFYLYAFSQEYQVLWSTTQTAFTISEPETERRR